jgi:hypothetical protein
MKRRLALALLAGCPSEGGVSFSYAMYAEGSTPTLVTSCAQVNITGVRFRMGNDANADGLLQDDVDDVAGRALEDCNQQGSTLGRFETATDRLEAGTYNLITVSFAPFVDATSQSRYFTRNNYAETWAFEVPLVIEEGKITNISFASFEGGTPELRMVLQP